jgi:hypothetical protein
MALSTLAKRLGKHGKVTKPCNVYNTSPIRYAKSKGLTSPEESLSFALKLVESQWKNGDHGGVAGMGATMSITKSRNLTFFRVFSKALTATGIPITLA